MSILLDVRESYEFEEGHHPQAVNLPLSSIVEGATLNTNEATKIFVYCRSGNRSQKAQELLSRRGFSNVVNVGGVKDIEGMKF